MTDSKSSNTEPSNLERVLSMGVLCFASYGSVNHAETALHSNDVISTKVATVVCCIALAAIFAKQALIRATKLMPSSGI